MSSDNENELLDPTQNPDNVSSHSASSTSSSSSSSAPETAPSSLSIAGYSSLGFRYDDLIDLPDDFPVLLSRLDRGESAETLLLNKDADEATKQQLADDKAAWHERMLAIQFLDYFRGGEYLRGLITNALPKEATDPAFIAGYEQVRNTFKTFAEMNQGFTKVLANYHCSDETAILKMLDQYAIARDALPNLIMLISIAEKMIHAHRQSFMTLHEETLVFFSLTIAKRFKEILDVLSKISDVARIDEALAQMHTAISHILVYVSEKAQVFIHNIQQLSDDQQLEWINDLLMLGDMYDNANIISAAILFLHALPARQHTSSTSSSTSSRPSTHGLIAKLLDTFSKNTDTFIDIAHTLPEQLFDTLSKHVGPFIDSTRTLPAEQQLRWIEVLAESKRDVLVSVALMLWTYLHAESTFESATTITESQTLKDAVLTGTAEIIAIGASLSVEQQHNLAEKLLTLGLAYFDNTLDETSIVRYKSCIEAVFALSPQCLQSILPSIIEKALKLPFETQLQYTHTLLAWGNTYNNDTLISAVLTLTLSLHTMQSQPYAIVSSSTSSEPHTSVAPAQSIDKLLAELFDVFSKNMDAFISIARTLPAKQQLILIDLLASQNKNVLISAARALWIYRYATPLDALIKETISPAVITAISTKSTEMMAVVRMLTPEEQQKLTENLLTLSVAYRIPSTTTTDMSISAPDVDSTERAEYDALKSCMYIDIAFALLPQYAQNVIPYIIDNVGSLSPQAKMLWITTLLTMGIEHHSDGFISTAFILLLSLRAQSLQASAISPTSSSSTEAPTLTMSYENLPDSICSLILQSYEQKIQNNLLLHLRKLLALAYRKNEELGTQSYEPNIELDGSMKNYLYTLIIEPRNKEKTKNLKPSEVSHLLYTEYLKKAVVTLNQKNQPSIAKYLSESVGFLLRQTQGYKEDQDTLYKEFFKETFLYDSDKLAGKHRDICRQYDTYVLQQQISLSHILLLLIKRFLLSTGSSAEIGNLHKDFSIRFPDTAENGAICIENTAEAGNLVTFLLALINYIHHIDLNERHQIALLCLVNALLKAKTSLCFDGYTLGDFAVVLFLSISAKSQSPSMPNLAWPTVAQFLRKTEHTEKSLFMSEAHTLALKLTRSDLIERTMPEQLERSGLAIIDTINALKPHEVPSSDTTTPTSMKTSEESVEFKLANLLFSIINTLQRNVVTPTARQHTQSMPNLSRPSASCSSLYGGSGGPGSTSSSSTLRSSSSSSSTPAPSTGLPSRSASTTNISDSHVQRMEEKPAAPPVASLESEDDSGCRLM